MNYAAFEQCQVQDTATGDVMHARERHIRGKFATRHIHRTVDRGMLNTGGELGFD